MTTTHIFLGPTLTWTDARGVLPDAEYLPPAKAGDVYGSVKAGAKVIGIVDGYFEQVPSIWHKEILYALSNGVRVFGASSMGALRAAELHPFGMVGVGRIFEAYRDGEYEDDDEVVVVHVGEERNFAPRSEAMVNIRKGLADALTRKLITQPTHDILTAQLKAFHYPDRSWLAVPELASQHGLPGTEIAALMQFVKSESPNAKRSDALELLTVVREFGPQPERFKPEFEFENTVFWDELVSGVRTGPNTGAAIGIEALRSHIGLVEDDATTIFGNSLLLYLAVKEAHRVGLEPDTEAVLRMGERFRRSHGLTTPGATAEWMSGNAMSQKEFDALIEVLAMVDAVAKHHQNGVDAFLPPELQRRGRFATVAAAIAEKRSALAEYGNTYPSAEDLGTTPDGLLDWYEDRFRTIDGSLQDHIDERRFTTANRFIRELISEYICGRAEHR